MDGPDEPGHDRLDCFMRWFFGICTCMALSAMAAPGAWAQGYPLTPAGNAKFLADFAAVKDAIKLPDGVMYRVLEAGKGPGPLGRQDQVSVEYRGWRIDGAVFDQTHPGEPRDFQVGGVIAAATEALLKMKTGDTWQIVIPAALAYGATGIGTAIPPTRRWCSW